MDGARIARMVGVAVPGARVERIWPLQGGISARLFGVQVLRPDGAAERLVARQPPVRAAEEYLLLEALHREGLPVPTPRGFDPDSQPAFLLGYVEGAVELHPFDLESYLTRYTAQLAAIHSVDPSRLPPLDVEASEVRAQRPDPNLDLREPEVRVALVAYGPPRAPNPAVFRHGDFWPGNVLWRNGEIAAVIDWEEALLGEPLADLAICRLDVLWTFGPAAMETFTRRYLEARPLRTDDLAYWDLRASLRPMANLPEWSGSYPSLGRPDVDSETMHRDHRWFVGRALRELGS